MTAAIRSGASAAYVPGYMLLRRGAVRSSLHKVGLVNGKVTGLLPRRQAGPEGSRPGSQRFDVDDGGGQGPPGRDGQADFGQGGAGDPHAGKAGLDQAA